MSPEIMSDIITEKVPTNLDQALSQVESKPSKRLGRWSPLEMSEWRQKIRSVFVGMQADEAYKQKLAEHKLTREPEILSGQFETDAEKAIKKDVIELEAEEPTQSHLGANSEPIGISNQRSETPREQIKSAA